VSVFCLVSTEAKFSRICAPSSEVGDSSWKFVIFSDIHPEYTKSPNRHCPQ
jgi:hypothetical protein